MCHTFLNTFSNTLLMDEEALKQFLSSFTDDNGEPFEVTPEGSLGLFALGDLGLAAWRMVRTRAAEEMMEQAEKQR